VFPLITSVAIERQIAHPGERTGQIRRLSHNLPGHVELVAAGDFFGGATVLIVILPAEVYPYSADRRVYKQVDEIAPIIGKVADERQQPVTAASSFPKPWPGATR
jgi:hypothetical protein